MRIKTTVCENKFMWIKSQDLSGKSVICSELDDDYVVNYGNKVCNL